MVKTIVEIKQKLKSNTHNKINYDVNGISNQKQKTKTNKTENIQDQDVYKQPLADCKQQN